MAVAHRVSGDKIRQARLRAGLTQAALARAVKTSERNIVRWENDRNAPRMEHVAAIAEATDTDIAALLDSADDDEEEAAPMPLSRDELTLYGALTARIVAAAQTGAQV